MGFNNLQRLLFGLLIIASFSSLGQAKKPTIMILPSDNWCEQRYFMTEFDNQGSKQKVPNYKQAFQEDTELNQVISQIGSLMIDRGFPLKDAEQELKAIEAREAEMNMTSSKSTGSSVSESPLDKLKNKAKADILIQIWWKVNKTESGKSVSFVLEAFDTYTSKRIASSTGTGSPNSQDIVPILIQKAVLEKVDAFNTQLLGHFDDMFKNGREIRLTVRKWDSWENDLETEVDGTELTEHIVNWVRDNTVSKRYSLSGASENLMSFEQVRIPLLDESGNPIDARQFARGLQKHLKGSPYGYDVKLLTRGLGEAILILGEK
jgi:hypothetical protein